jgi:hypothetical protein
MLCVPAIRGCADTSRQFAGGASGQGGCRQFDGDATACNSHFIEADDLPMACTYNVSLDQCHGCGGGGNGAPGCLNTCITCADDALTQLTDGRTCNGVGDEGTCNVSWHVGGFGAERCFWDAVDMRCRGCGPPNELGDGNCSVTTGTTCFEDGGCPVTETCVNHVSKCANTCRE